MPGAHGTALFLTPGRRQNEFGKKHLSPPIYPRVFCDIGAQRNRYDGRLVYKMGTTAWAVQELERPKLYRRFQVNSLHTRVSTVASLLYDLP